MAKLLDVSRSGYYKFLNLRLSVRLQEEAKLLARIKAIYDLHRGRYGSPRIHQVLLREGYGCSRKRVARLMSLNGLKAKSRKRFKLTTKVDKAAAFSPNVLHQEFNAKAPNQKWVADVTYIWTGEGWLYLAVILDLFSRKVVGMAMKDNLRSEIVTEALKQAIKRRGPAPGLIHHSDRGIQYTCAAFQGLLKEKDIICSMSRKGNCFDTDNAVAESFFHTLKAECVYFNTYTTRAEAKQSLFELYKFKSDLTVTRF